MVETCKQVKGNEKALPLELYLRKLASEIGPLSSDSDSVSLKDAVSIQQLDEVEEVKHMHNKMTVRQLIA